MHLDWPDRDAYRSLQEELHWGKFIRCTGEGMSARKPAKEVGISAPTAFLLLGRKVWSTSR
ncbi:MAG: hypothetical protein H5U02_13665 [Clostridia bacterium]|nr:hypothetical protein [Clostridia bacterium]